MDSRIGGVIARRSKRAIGVVALVVSGTVPSLAAGAQSMVVVASLGQVDLERDADPRFGYRGSFGAGVATRISVLGPVMVGVELLNTGRGATYRDEDELLEQRSRYWAVPVSLGIGGKPIEAIGVNVGGGVEFGLMQSCTLETGARIPVPGGGEVFPTSTQDCNDGSPGAIPNFYTRDSEVGAFGDIEVSWHSGRLVGLAGFRMQRGLRSIVPPNRTGDVRSRSHWLRLGLGVRL